MLDGVQLRYGWVGGGKSGQPVKVYASEPILAPGSRFVEMSTGAGYASFLDDQDAVEIFGSLECPYKTFSATSGLDGAFLCITDITAVYKVPVETGTFAITDIGDTCDVGLSSANLQGAYLQASTVEQLIVLQGDIQNNEWCLVRMNPNAQGLVNSA